MDLHLAAIIAHDTHDQAVNDARTDLHRLQQQAIEAGRDESRRLIKVSHIDHPTGQATYRPAGRLLRDWYLHCYTNNLRSRLGSPAVAIDAQQVEDTTKLLHRLTPNRSALAALRAVAVLRDLADADAAHATVSIADTLHATAARRAVAHAPDRRFDADPVRIHVTRHWYLHSYLNDVHTATRSQWSYASNVSIERQVAVTLSTRMIHPLVSDAARTLTSASDGEPDRKHLDVDPAVADDPRLPIDDASPGEAARLMFNHRVELQGPIGHCLDETSRSQLPGSGETARDSEPEGRSNAPRIA